MTGASPTVDVQSTTKSQVLNREALDAIPTGRTIQGMGQLITGVSLNQPDVGGSKAMQQTYMSAHGAGASQTTVQVDGLMVNGLDVRRRGAELLQQLDEPGDGLHDLRRVGRRGRRRRAPQHDSARRRQQDERQPLPRLPAEELPDATTCRDDAQGQGPEVAPTASTSCRTSKAPSAARSRRTRSGTSRRPARSTSTRCRPTRSSGFPAPARRPRRPSPSTEPGVDAQSINSVQARVTWQMSPKTKLAVYNDRLAKNRGVRHDRRASIPRPPASSGTRRSTRRAR